MGAYFQLLGVALPAAVPSLRKLRIKCQTSYFFLSSDLERPREKAHVDDLEFVTLGPVDWLVEELGKDVDVEIAPSRDVYSVLAAGGRDGRADESDDGDVERRKDGMGRERRGDERFWRLRKFGLTKGGAKGGEVGYWVRYGMFQDYYPGIV